MAIARVTNLVRCIEELREAGIWTVATVPDGTEELRSVDLRGPIALVLGGEGQGIRPLVRKNCDHAVRIPMLGMVQSLNLSVSVAVILYEALRQRAAKGYFDKAQLPAEEFERLKKRWLNLSQE